MNPTLQRAVDLVCAACPDVAGIYLYGSFDSPYRRDESDLGLAILSPHPLGAVACWNLAQDVAVAVDRDVDVVDLQAASTVLRFQNILEKHLDDFTEYTSTLLGLESAGD